MLFKVVRQDKTEITVQGDYASLDGDVFKAYTHNSYAGTALSTKDIETNLVACIPETDYFTRD